MYSFVNLSAQKEPNIKLKLEVGLSWKPAEKERTYWDWAPLFSLEPKLKTSKKTFIGLRIQVTENFPNNDEYKPLQFFIDNNISINFLEAPSSTNLISVVPTFDYYFSRKRFSPYLGAGIGYYFLTTSKGVSVFGTSFVDELETSVDNPVGLLIRGGLGMRKLSVGLEFNYLLEANIKIPNGLIIGTVDESFIVLSIGYTFGIGKHRNNK